MSERTVQEAAERLLVEVEINRDTESRFADDIKTVAKFALGAAERLAEKDAEIERLRAALTEVVRIIDHEQRLGNGFRIREVARAALAPPAERRADRRAGGRGVGQGQRSELRVPRLAGGGVGGDRALTSRIRTASERRGGSCAGCWPDPPKYVHSDNDKMSTV